MTAHDDLRDALEDALDARQAIPCCPPAPPWWIAEDAAQRTQAAARCQPCPVITACATAAESTRERFGVVGRHRPDADETEGDAVTDPTRPRLDHAPSCQRTRPPILRLSWQAHPEAWCPECGRTAPAADTRPAQGRGES